MFAVKCDAEDANASVSRLDTRLRAASAWQAARRLQWGWLEGNEHIRNAGGALVDCVFSPMRDLMAFVHGDLAIHSNVEIDVEVQSHFAGAAFFNFDHAGNGAGN